MLDFAGRNARPGDPLHAVAATVYGHGARSIRQRHGHAARRHLVGRTAGGWRDDHAQRAVHAPAAAGSDTVTAQSGALLATASVTIVAPVGWWKLNEGTGTTADDSSASADNGTIVNGTWLQPPNGFNGAPALQFNGQSLASPAWCKLGSPAVLNFSGQITLSAWIKPASITQSQYILDHRASMTNDLFLMINGNGTYQVGVESNSTFYGASASIPSQDLNAWVHLAGTYDGTTWRLYRDGQLVASSTASIGAISISPVGIYKPTWGIGAATSFPFGGIQYFAGAIDDVRIYNTAISSSAISGLEAIPPTVATPAAASPPTVTGTTAALSVLGADAAGELTLTYTWTTTGTPPGDPRCGELFGQRHPGGTQHHGHIHRGRDLQLPRYDRQRRRANRRQQRGRDGEPNADQHHRCRPAVGSDGVRPVRQSPGQSAGIRLRLRYDQRRAGAGQQRNRGPGRRQPTDPLRRDQWRRHADR